MLWLQDAVRYSSLVVSGDTAIQAVLSGVGISIILLAALLQEQEERLVQDTLETWWLKLDAVSATALSRHVAFLKLTFALAAETLDRVFGKRPITFRAFIYSCALSFASSSIFISYEIWRAVPVLRLVVPATAVVFFAFVCVLIWKRALTLLCGLVVGMIAGLLANAAMNPIYPLLWGEPIGIAVGVLFDYIYIIIARRAFNYLRSSATMPILLLSAMFYSLLTCVQVIWMMPWLQLRRFSWLYVGEMKYGIPAPIAYVIKLAGTIRHGLLSRYVAPCLCIASPGPSSRGLCTHFSAFGCFKAAERWLRLVQEWS